MKLLDNEGPASVKLDRLKADKITVPASLFEIPTGFKEAMCDRKPSEEAVLMGFKTFFLDFEWTRTFTPSAAISKL